MDVSNKIYWMKVFLAIVIGITNGFTGILHWPGAVIGVIGLFGTYPIALMLIRLTESQSPEAAQLTPVKILTNGLPAYLFVWVVSWTVVFNLLNPFYFT
ncbi:MAG: Rab5-interacting family protein [Candidatus Lokiarchaeota archaeon]|nr:Rab5-interacting family protein [Candidatus Lokiarchaeota archaeon]